MTSSLIRNFAIIAHVDHGKSTLADRFLEITQTVDKRHFHDQLLDSHPVSRERGITIRLAPVTMNYLLTANRYLLNLIDTPGHVDFSYEVERSLAACEGAILLVDATQGIQAQTLSHLRKAQKLGLKIIPAINKIDLPNANVEETEKELRDLLNDDGGRFASSSLFARVSGTALGTDQTAEQKEWRETKTPIYHLSAKTGQGVKELLEAVIKEVPPPAPARIATQSVAGETATETLIFSSQYSQERGVIAFVKVLSGVLTGEVGHFTPEMTPAPKLEAGEVGYLLTGIKDPQKVSLWAGYKPPKPMVFVSFFPVNPDEFKLLEDALKKLRLNDAAITFSPTSSKALGRGFKCGFLGHLHAEVSQERLEADSGISVIATMPTVEYKQNEISNFKFQISNSLEEPWVKATIITPQEFVGAVMTLCDQRRGKLINMEYHGSPRSGGAGSQVTIFYELPLAEIITDFFDQLKSKSSGFASFDYELIDYRPFAAVQLDILINHEPIDAFSQIMEKTRAEKFGKMLVEKLAQIIPRQQIPIPIQAAIDGSPRSGGAGQIIARADIKQFRKDVTAKLYGGDVTRRMKLLEKQKKGKEKMKNIGKVQIPNDTFLKVFQT